MSDIPDLSWIEFEDFFGRTVQPPPALIVNTPEDANE